MVGKGKGQVQRAAMTDRESQGGNQKLLVGGRHGWTQEIKTNGNASERSKKCWAFRQSNS